MSFVRATAVVLFLQGLLVLAGFLYLNETGEIILLLITATYALLALGLWCGRGWAVLPGMALTLPQLVLVSTWPFSWACFVGVTCGVGFLFTPNEARPYPGLFHSVGVQLVEGRAGYNRALSAMLTPGGPTPYFGVNLVAVYVLSLLLFCWLRRRKLFRLALFVVTALYGYLAPGALRAASGALSTTSSTAVAPAETLSTCVTAIAAQSDPAKLATLGKRQANPRLKRILYYLAEARAAGADPAAVIDQAQQRNGSASTPRAPLVKASLLRNLKICDGLGMITPENLAKLKRGNAPTVMRGPYAGQIAEVDHIVPLAEAGQVGNELANLELLPAALNRAKSDKVGERQLALAKRFHDAGLLSDVEFADVQARFRPAGTEKYQLQDQQ